MQQSNTQVLVSIINWRIELLTCYSYREWWLQLAPEDSERMLILPSTTWDSNHLKVLITFTSTHGPTSMQQVKMLPKLTVTHPSSIILTTSSETTIWNGVCVLLIISSNGASVCIVLMMPGLKLFLATLDSVSWCSQLHQSGKFISHSLLLWQLLVLEIKVLSLLLMRSGFLIKFSRMKSWTNFLLQPLIT